MKKQIKTNVMVIARKFPAVSFSPYDPVETRFSATEFGVLFRRSLWHLLLFLLFSMAAFAMQDFDLFAATPEDFWMLLGSPPPPALIHLVLAIYAFCALMLLPARMNKASLMQSWAHMGYRTIFYLFYLSANALTDHFMIVFAIGLVLYGLEQFYLLLHLSKNVLNANEQIRKS